MNWRSFAIGVGTTLLVNLLWHFIKKWLENRTPKIILLKQPSPFAYGRGPGMTADDRKGLQILFTIRQEDIEQKPFVVYEKALVEAYYESKKLTTPNSSQSLELRLFVDNGKSGQFPNNLIKLNLDEIYKKGTLFKIALEYKFKDVNHKTNVIEYILE